MNAPFAPRLPQCPCCTSPVYEWRRGSWLEPCRRCKRPLVLIRWPLDWNGPRRLRGLLDVVATGHGVATILLVLLFILSDMTPLRLVKAITVLLFVIESVLLVDGDLSIRTRIERTWGRRSNGGQALVCGTGKIASGAFALLLCAMWLSL